MDLISILQFGLNFFELIACTIGFIYLQKLKNSYWKWFPIYLAVITSVELIGKYLRLVKEAKYDNIHLYQYFGIPIQFLFFYWLFFKNFSRQWQKITALSGIIIFLIFWLDEIFSRDKSPYWFISLSYDAGIIVLLVLVLIYLIKLSTTNEILNFKWNIMFWVVIGLFAGYICTIPYFLWRNYLITYEKSKPELLYVPFYVFMFLNYLMYSLFCVGFIKWKQTS